MKNLIVWGALTAAATTAYGQTHSDFTIKTFSGPCGKDATGKGSGLLIQDKNEVYVLSSDHVIEEGDKGRICNEGKNETAGDVKLDLIAKEWGNGLSLLKVREKDRRQMDEKFVRSLPTLADFDIRTPKAGERVVVSGYPAEFSNRATEHDQGVVLSPQSERQIFPSDFKVIEVNQSHGEFGMSGGPVYSKQNGKIIGVLSHRIPVEVPGNRTLIDNVENQKSWRQSHLFVIPAQEAKSWAEKVLKAPSQFKPRFQLRTLKEGGIEKQILRTNGVEFEFENKGVKYIMGGDPVGVGGHGNEAAHVTYGMIKMRWNPSVEKLASDSKLKSAPWWGDLMKQLQVHGELYVYSLVKEVKKGGGAADEGELWSRTPIYSLEQFFCRANEAGIIPVTMTGKVLEAQSKDGNFEIEASSPLSSAAKPGVEAIKILKAANLSEEDLAFVEGVEMTLILARSVQWGALKVSRLQELLGDEDVSKTRWSSLFNVGSQAEFDAAVDLRHALEKLLEEVRRRN